MQHPAARQHQHHPPSRSTTQPQPQRPSIVVPTNLPQAAVEFLDTVALHVVIGGPAVEEAIIERERGNSYFAFMTALWNDPLNVYYRWRCYSLLQGDSLTRWRTAPFVMEADASSSSADRPPPLWVPPPCPAGTNMADAQQRVSSHNNNSSSSGSNNNNHDAAGGGGGGSSSFASLVRSEGLLVEPLPRRERHEWQVKLSNISALGSNLRERIADAMVFAIDHSRFAFDICELLVQSLSLEDRAMRVLAARREREHVLQLFAARAVTRERAVERLRGCDHDVAGTVSALLARMFLLSDILLNSLTAVVEAGVGGGVSQQQQTSSRPTHLAKALALLLPRVLDGIASFVLWTRGMDNNNNDNNQLGSVDDGKRGSGVKAPPAVANDKGDNERDLSSSTMLITIATHDPAHAVTGWCRELWALWCISGAVSETMIKKMEERFAFLLLC